MGGPHPLGPRGLAAAAALALEAGPILEGPRARQVSIARLALRPCLWLVSHLGGSGFFTHCGKHKSGVSWIHTVVNGAVHSSGCGECTCPTSDGVRGRVRRRALPQNSVQGVSHPEEVVRGCVPPRCETSLK